MHILSLAIFTVENNNLLFKLTLTLTWKCHSLAPTCWMIREGRVYGEWPLVLRSVLCPGGDPEGPEVAPAVTPTLGTEPVPGPGPDPLLPALRHRGEVQDVIKLLRALVMSLKRHVAAGLGGLEHRNYVKSVQLE